jgi:hypothetical protein
MPPLHIVGSPDAISTAPPATLGEAGQRLWRAVTNEFHIDDVGGRELLRQASECADRLASLTARIQADGEVIRGKSGVRAHPLLAPEIAARAFICRTLQRLGLDLEPLRLGPGRPPGRGAA